ncbi:MAG: hypothetical protein EXR75_12855 [Myxococcales bacterium]|nr:hypothetical protein [Myxococcales bacterium]
MSRIAWVMALCAGGAMAAACSATQSVDDGSGKTGSGAGMSTSAGATGGDTSVGAGGNTTSGSVTGSGSVGSGGCSGNSCSPDLKSIVDCDGMTVATCPPEQACANGMCIDDPCDAAAQSKSSVGCDYWAVKTDLIMQAKGACFATFVVNTWGSPAHIAVSRDGKSLPNNGFIVLPVGQGANIKYLPYDDNVGLAVGGVAILFLSHENPFIPFVPKCPAPVAMVGESGVLGTARGKAFHITTDVPVVMYSILPYGGGAAAMTSASLMLPTSAWDTNYIAVNPYANTTLEHASYAHPSLNILAHEDATEVTLLPKVAIEAGPAVVGSNANVPVTYTLNAGEYVQLSQTAELTGSPIQSNKPVGVWGAASCMNIPVGTTACDGAHQQIPPVKALGSEYALVRYKNRKSANGEETPPWRIVGAVDGTTLKWTPSTPPGAPTTVAFGKVYEFNAAGPYIVASQDEQHPFYVAQYMTSADHVSAAGEGDPEWVNVIPIAQYLTHYVFFSDPTYPETSLVVLRKKDKNDTFKDVTLACAGKLGGWQPLGNMEYTRVDLVTGNFQDVGKCSNGRNEIESEAPVGLTVWGWGGSTFPPSGYVSYGYPAGASVKPINAVTVVPKPQ